MSICPHCGELRRDCCDSVITLEHQASCAWAALIDTGDAAAAAALLVRLRTKNHVATLTPAPVSFTPAELLPRPGI